MQKNNQIETSDHFRKGSETRLPRGFLMKRKQKRICLTDEACTDLLMLLNSGFSFQESMDLLEEEGKQQVWQKIRRHLINGEEAGRFMGKYLPSDKVQLRLVQRNNSTGLFSVLLLLPNQEQFPEYQLLSR